MPKSETSNKTFLSWICAIAGLRFSTFVVQTAVRRRCRHEEIHLPSGIAAAKSVLIILPEDFLNETAFSEVLASLPANITIVLLCENSNAALFKNMKNVSEIIGYNAENRFLFSREMNALGKQAALTEYDICVSLERDSHLALLYLVSESRPAIRIGYDKSDSDFFFNVRLRDKSESVAARPADYSSITAFFSNLRVESKLPKSHAMHGGGKQDGVFGNGEIGLETLK
jgi:hypothetical protein